MKKKLQKICLTYYNLFIAQGLWQGHYQILSTTFLKSLTKLNLSTVTIVNNMKHVELNLSVVTVFLITQILKTI